jgi:hypothetical protein
MWRTCARAARWSTDILVSGARPLWLGPTFFFDRRPQFSVWLEQPYRLILEPAHDPVPQIEDGTIDRRQVTAVSIIEIVDYH